MDIEKQIKDTAPICLLWDESHLWGVMMLHALQDLGIPCHIIRSSQIRQGVLQKNPPQALLVPGGWAARKSWSLGRCGRQAIRDYVHKQGTYLGICGGAGLALQETGPGLGLCPWRRKSMSNRLPNCSGHIQLEPAQDPDLQPVLGTKTIPGPVWWPSQFASDNSPRIQVLARYLHPEQDFWVADLALQDLDPDLLHAWQKLYAINLDPRFLNSDPAIIQGSYGQGRYLLSYVHLETPESAPANVWLQNILLYYCPGLFEKKTRGVSSWDLQNLKLEWDEPSLYSAWQDILSLIDLGRTHFLLGWRKPWLLGWKRGLPGFSLNTVLALLAQVLQHQAGPQTKKFWLQHRSSLLNLLQTFCRFYRYYMLQERLQLTIQNQPPQAGGSLELAQLRQLLTGPFPGQGGLFGRLCHILQELIWCQTIDSWKL